MSKFVPDVKTTRWVVIAPSRVRRPDQFAPKVDVTVAEQKKVCVFCPGNEALTPPEVWRIGGEGEWNKPGWKVRIVPNKYPITDIHEVIIHSPDDRHDIENLPKEHVQLILQAYRSRYQTHQHDGQVMIFCNHGEHAGASLTHPHSQLVVIPRQINLDTLEREPLTNVVNENTYFIVYCPDFSQWPYEVWIVPKKEKTTFGQIEDHELVDLAQILQTTLNKLGTIYENRVAQKLQTSPTFNYNYYIFHGENWYLRIIPRLIHRAGFELGSGLQVNIIDPAIAAEELKG